MTLKPVAVLTCILFGLTLVVVLLFSLSQPGRADPAIIYVDKDAPGPIQNGESWSTAYRDLQLALTAALVGDEIWVADGVYKPGASGNRNANFQLKSGVALYGGFSGNESLRSERDWRNHVTVLSGDIDGNDVSDTNGVVITSTNVLGSNTYQVVTGSNIDASAVLDGFIITAGSQGDSWSGAGIDLSGNANPTLTNLVISGNYGNGIASNSSDPNIINVVFLGNLQGMRNMSSQPKLTNVVFSGNSGGSWGYVILNDSSAIVMINVIFQGNYGDVMFSLDWAWGQPVLTNCIIWGNTTSSGYGQIVPDGSAEVTYSIVQGGYTGTGNKGVDPRFIDPDGDDNIPGTLDDNWRLYLDSPAIDAGDNSALPPDLLDLDGDGNTAEHLPVDLGGNTRKVDMPSVVDTGNGTPPIVDMGAYESNILISLLPIILVLE